MHTTFTVAEFFAGIGLVRMALERVGGQVLFANDIDPLKYQMYKHEFGDSDGKFRLGDIHEIKGTDIPEVDLATASFPCTDLSLAGARKGLSGDHSSTFWEFLRIITEMQLRPRLLLIENVPGFLTSHEGKDFTLAVQALNGLGYAVDPILVDAVDFVPQSRLRLFLVARHNTRSTEIRERPKQYGFFEQIGRPKNIADLIFSHPDLMWDLAELPPLPTRHTRLADVLEDYPKSDPIWWNRERSDYLISQMSHRHKSIADQMIQGTEWTYGTVFRRVRNGVTRAELRTDGVAGCLRTPKGGSGRQILIKMGFGDHQVRLLSGRECARLMGADHYNLNVPLNQALFGFGDAFCVPAVTWVATHAILPYLCIKALSA